MDKSGSTVSFAGLGYKVGSKLRKNSWKGFDYLRSHYPADGNAPRFTGFKTRAVLAHGETLSDIMVGAAKGALEQANLQPADIDVIVGAGSVAEYITPNNLAEVHQRLKMRDDCWILPCDSEETNYLTSLITAADSLRAGRGSTALVVCGSNWTKHVDYHQPPGYSVGDGACAAVLTLGNQPGKFELVDGATFADTSLYGAMTMNPRPLELDGRLGVFTKPLFNLGLAGPEAFSKFGKEQPPLLVNRLLNKHAIAPAEVAFVPQQSSDVLIEAWAKKIGAKDSQMFETLSRWGNMIMASVGVNLAFFDDDIKSRYVVMFGVGHQLNTTAVLLQRNQLRR